jgi:bifunctional non-homologous end joining protein LigD
VLGVPITNPARVVYPEFGFTKLDLARLYEDLAELALPYIANRPLTLVRCEKGVHEEDALRRECKFLKHEPGWHRWARPPIRRVQIREQKKLGEYLVVDSPEGLIALIQGDIIELHVWNATIDRIEQPDRIVFDFDPGDEVPWPQVLHAARLLRTALEKLGLECWPKLTGGKGLHVVLPFRAEHGWPEVYAFSRAVAESVVREQPDCLTLDFARAGRRAKILIDYKRNHRAAVAVAAYSTRANPAAALSVPLAWSELKPRLAPRAFTVRNIRRRLKQDPWRDYWTCKQRLR